MSAAPPLPWLSTRDLFSEFSYGFALTNELVVVSQPPIVSAPVFPSLIKEGGKGGGYDVALDRPGKPLFLQFKLSQWIQRRNATEARLGEMDPPLYRMHLRTRKKSQQHALLLDLEAAGLGEVFYCAPAFATVGELNQRYQDGLVEAESRFVTPSSLPPITDDDDHWLSFKASRSGPTRFYSEQSIPLELDSTPVADRLAKALRSLPPTSKLSDYVERLAVWFDRMGLARERIQASLPEETKGHAQERSVELTAMEKVAISAHTLLNCSFCVIQQRSPAEA